MANFHSYIFVNCIYFEKFQSYILMVLKEKVSSYCFDLIKYDALNTINNFVLNQSLIGLYLNYHLFLGFSFFFRFWFFFCVCVLFGGGVWVRCKKNIHQDSRVFVLFISMTICYQNLYF